MGRKYVCNIEQDAYCQQQFENMLNYLHYKFSMWPHWFTAMLLPCFVTYRFVALISPLCTARRNFLSSMESCVLTRFLRNVFRVLLAFWPWKDKRIPTVPCLLKLDTRWRWVVSLIMHPLYSHGKIPQCPRNRKMDGPPCLSRLEGEDRNPLSLPEIELQFQPTA